MSRPFQKVDYAATLKQTITIEDCLPPEHLARFVVDAVGMLDLAGFYERYQVKGAPPIAPEVLLAILLYGYATGVFSSRKLEQGTYESIPFRYVAGGLHPDHDTLANFRKSFLNEIKDVFVQVLELAHTQGILRMGNISLDGSKIHADASKSKAVSYKRMRELQERLEKEVDELLRLGEDGPSEGQSKPADLNVAAELRYRRDRLANLAEAKRVLDERAKERDEKEKAAYDEKVHEREEKVRKTGRRPGGRDPKPPTPGPRDKDQYNFTDPESRIMKNSSDGGFDQSYNAQAAVDQATLLIVGNHLSNHPSDTAEALPTIDAIPTQLGLPKAVAMDCGYFTQNNLDGLASRAIDPYIATGRDAHRQDWKASATLAGPASQPPDDATPRVKMAYKLKSQAGQAIYGLRKSTVEPVIGIIKEVLGFIQFSLRGIVAAAGEWTLVCIAFNLKRLHVLQLALR